jgi:hypothetical protein
LDTPLSVETFLEILQKDRCPICFLLSAAGLERLKSMLNEYVNDPGVRKRVSRSRGFCRRHAWQAVSSGNNPVGVGLIHHTLLKEESDRIGRTASRPSFLTKGTVPPDCIFCSWERHIEDNFSRLFAACWAASNKLREEFDKNGILCVPHLERAIRYSRRRQDRVALAAAGLRALDLLLKELEEFLDKQDYRRSHEKAGEEWDAWIRAVRMMVGEKGV